MVVFIHAFAWIFVLSSVIPSVILGKGRSVLVQFFLCLTLVLVATLVEDALKLMMERQPIYQLGSVSTWLQNPILAGAYLSIPYLFMLYLDIRSKKKSKDESMVKQLDDTDSF